MKHTIAVSLSALALGAACTAATAGEAKTSQARDVAGFTEIDASGAFEIHIEQGEAYAVTVKAAPEDLAHVRTERDGKTLEISWEGVRLFGGGPVEIHVTTPKLERLETSGATAVRARGLRGERLEVEASGASKLALSGQVTKVVYEVSGATKLDALGLDAEVVEIDASGATHAKVRATRAITADASGASSIRYAGGPAEVRSDLSGASKLERI